MIVFMAVLAVLASASLSAGNSCVKTLTVFLLAAGFATPAPSLTLLTATTSLGSNSLLSPLDSLRCGVCIVTVVAIAVLSACLAYCKTLAIELKTLSFFAVASSTLCLYTSKTRLFLLNAP